MSGAEHKRLYPPAQTCTTYRFFGLLLIFTEMDPNTSRFDDPQCTRDGLPLQHCKEVLQPLYDTSKACSRPAVQHNYPGALLGRKPSDLAEISIESDKRSSLG